jgi:hypothetical protein
MRLLAAAVVPGRHVCHARADAVRVAESLCAEFRDDLVAVVRCTRCGGRTFRVVQCRVKVRDPVEAEIDALRAAPYTTWGTVYARLARRLPASAVVQTEGLVEVRPAPEPTAHRGAWYWRWYYGAPSASPAEMIRAHVAAAGRWDASIARAPRAAEAPYASAVRRLAQAAAERFAEGAPALDAARMREAILHPDFEVRIIDRGHRLAGALYPLHALTRGVAATEADFHDNRRALAVQRLRGAPLRRLLAHELAHAVFPPVWMAENHPPAFERYAAALLRLLPADEKKPAARR